MPGMDGLQMTKMIREILTEEYKDDIFNVPLLQIWAITAMNETELEGKISA